MQHPQGSWYAYYTGDDVKDKTLDTNVSCYIANGVWHHYLCTRDAGFLESMFPVVARASELELDHPHPPRALCTSRSTISTRPARSNGMSTRRASRAKARCSPAHSPSPRRCAAPSPPP